MPSGVGWVALAWPVLNMRRCESFAHTRQTWLDETVAVIPIVVALTIAA
jgi:hypothetical protein